MRAREFVTESVYKQGIAKDIQRIIDEGLNVVGTFDISGTHFLLHQHAIDRTKERDVTPSSVKTVVSQLPKVLGQIKQYEPGQQFYVTDTRLSVSLGFRVLGGGKILLATVIPTSRPYARGDVPVLSVNEVQEHYQLDKD